MFDYKLVRKPRHNYVFITCVLFNIQQLHINISLMVSTINDLLNQ